jgi:hypothetical protein
MILDDLSPEQRQNLVIAHRLLEELLQICEETGDRTELDAVLEWMNVNTICVN